MKSLRDQRSGNRADVNIDALCTSMCARSIFGLKSLATTKCFKVVTHLLFDIEPLQYQCTTKKASQLLETSQVQIFNNESLK